MSANSNLASYKTWIEISDRAINQNVRSFRSIMKKGTRLFAVVKSNAYGHGLTLFGGLAAKAGVDGFCVDSVVEGIKLREAGIRQPILVLGPTLPDLFQEAKKRDLTVTVSNFESLAIIKKLRIAPHYHLKIDTGMHRQGFYLKDLPAVIKKIKSFGPKKDFLLAGAYTHFAAAKVIVYPTYTLGQLAIFEKARNIFLEAGFKNMIFHSAATGGALLYPQAHFDLVRIGIGLYGYWPSPESAVQHSLVWKKELRLTPILRWRSRITEIKNLQAGDIVGYDLTEKIKENSRAAIVPIGYWHGFPRSLSGCGEIIIGGRREKILGRVSMDLLTVSLRSKKSGYCQPVTLIGRDGSESLLADELAAKADTTAYELLTRLNPLIKRTEVS